jgi:hypothetical protein
LGVVVTMNKIFKFRSGNREIFGFYLDDKNVLFVREGLGCFFYQFHFRFGNFASYPLFLFIFNLSEGAIEMRYSLEDNVLEVDS